MGDISIWDMPRDSSQDVAAIFEAAIALGYPVQSVRNYMKAHDSVCESPIEQTLLDELLFCPFGYFDNLNQVVFQDDLPKSLEFGRSGAVIVPQATLGRLPYRVDFAVLLNTRGAQKPAPTIIVECDGHDFHERTKQQAARDRKRDRDIQNLGIPVLRFTGSEIYNGAAECVAQIDVFGVGILDRIWKAKGFIQ